VRRFFIQRFLPLVFCLLPLLAGAVIALAIPVDAMRYYLHRLSNSPMDWLILGIGAALFSAQSLLAWRALQWRGASFDERPDRWLTQLAQAAEWFPLLGLLGTVGGILQTFSALGVRQSLSPSEIISTYTPAITATGSGLFMALVNILPTWIVVFGRDLILTLSGQSSPTETGSKS
jgi:hypothetical protein